jgi:hypothetical protein
MATTEQTKPVPASAIVKGDIVLNPDTGKWFTVANVTMGELGNRGDMPEGSDETSNTYHFFGGENELVMTRVGDHALITRKVGE